MRFEWREQAIAGLVVQSEAMTASKTRGKRSTQPPANQREFRPNNGGINYGPPPLDVFKKLGMNTEM